MSISLSEHFTYKKLLRFVLPSIIMMIFTSIYGVVDGLFVSNYVGKTAFAGLNLIMPFIMALSALGFMMGTGGSAIVAKTLGEGKKKKANEYFSSVLMANIAIIPVILAVAVPVILNAEKLLDIPVELEESVKLLFFFILFNFLQFFIISTVRNPILFIHLIFQYW